MQYNKLQEKLLTGPVLFTCAMHISNTLIGTSANRWYCCRFACLPGNTARLRKANRYQISVPQPCNEPAWVNWWTTRFLRTNFLYQKKEAQLTERKFKKNNTTNIKSQTCPMNKENRKSYRSLYFLSLFNHNLLELFHREKSS